MMSSPVTFELPWPPSVNHYYRRVGARTLISSAGRKFRRQVAQILASRCLPPIVGRMAMTIEVYPPDRRRRDIDNLLKAVLDACQHGGAFPDDSRIVWLLIYRAQIVPGGRVVVTIHNLTNKQELPRDVDIWRSHMN